VALPAGEDAAGAWFVDGQQGNGRWCGAAAWSFRARSVSFRRNGLVVALAGVEGLHRGLGVEA
jgi:hypothetical protein